MILSRLAASFPCFILWFALGCALAASGGIALAESTPTTNESTPAGVVLGGSGLPVPRFVSLASNEVNMRAGPGRRYPIRWIYRQKGLPLKVEAEYDIWRKVRDHDGESGWIHGSLLSGRRTVVISGEIRGLHAKPHPASALILKAEAGVIAELLTCEGQWCRLRLAGKKGWMTRGHFWGLGTGTAGDH